MSQDTKFRVVQAPDTHKIRLELWRKYGDKPDEWMTDESLTDLTVSEFKELVEYVLSVTKRSNKHKQAGG